MWYVSPMYPRCITYVAEMEKEKFTITKRIAKHGKQAVIVIPKILNEELKPKTIVKLNIEILRRPEEDDKPNN